MKSDDISEFMSNPQIKGIYYAQIEINLSMFDKLHTYINDKLFDGECKIFNLVYEEAIKTKSEKKINDFFDMCIKLLYKGNLLNKNSIKYLNNILIEEHMMFDRNNNLFDIRISPFISYDEMIDDDIKKDYDKIAKYSLIDDQSFILNKIFESNILSDLSDVIILNNKYNEKHFVIIIEILTINKKTMDIFMNFLKSIPYINEYLKIIKKEKVYSIKYIIQLYPLITKLWLNTKQSIYISKEISNLLLTSLEYYEKKEWRPCILINAIIVEIIISNIYEEEKKEIAPNITLGALYHKVKIVFPKHVQKCIEELNKIRNVAVHRSKFPVSQLDANNSIYSTTTIITWFNANY